MAKAKGKGNSGLLVPAVATAVVLFVGEASRAKRREPKKRERLSVKVKPKLERAGDVVKTRQQRLCVLCGYVGLQPTTSAAQFGCQSRRGACVAKEA